MSEDFDSIFEELTPVTTNNRFARQGCHLLFNPDKGKNGKFEVSDALFRRLDLNNHGFTAMIGRGSVYLGVFPNEEAVTYAGRADSDNKSKEFTSTELRDSLTDLGMDGNQFWLQYTATKDGVDYYEVVTEEPTNEDTSTQEETETEEVAAAEEDTPQGVLTGQEDSF